MDFNGRSGEMGVFVSVAQEGSLSAAARTLGLTPSAVSRIIARTEQRLGTRLLLRTTRAITFTAEGATILQGQLEDSNVEPVQEIARMIEVQRAYELGYINRLMPKGQALQGAKELATRLMANAPLTVRAAKEMVRLSTEMGRTAALRASNRAFDAVYLSEDALEGPQSFREKRKPVWKGR